MDSQQRERQTLWEAVRFSKLASLQMEADIEELVRRYRLEMAGMELHSHGFYERIGRLSQAIARDKKVVHDWIDPPLQATAWYTKMEERYGRPSTFILEVVDNWLWTVIVAPAYLAAKRLLWRWRRHSPRGDIEVMRRGHAAMMDLLAKQELLRGLLSTALLPENQYPFQWADSLRRTRAVAGKLEQAAETEAREQAEAAAVIEPEPKPGPDGLVAVGAFGTRVDPALARTWEEGDGWKGNGREK